MDGRSWLLVGRSWLLRDPGGGLETVWDPGRNLGWGGRPGEGACSAPPRGLAVASASPSKRRGRPSSSPFLPMDLIPRGEEDPCLAALAVDRMAAQAQARVLVRVPEGESEAPCQGDWGGGFFPSLSSPGWARGQDGFVLVSRARRAMERRPAAGAAGAPWKAAWGEPAALSLLHIPRFGKGRPSYFLEARIKFFSGVRFHLKSCPAALQSERLSPRS